MTAKDALVNVSDMLNEFESFVEGFDPEHWSDPDLYPEDCDEVTGRFGSETLAEVGRSLDALKRVVELAGDIVRSENNIRAGNSAFEQVEAIEELAELTGVELVPLNES